MAKPRNVVTGVEEIDRKLQQFEPKLQKKVARKSLRKAGKLVKQSAQTNLDKNDTNETGQTRRGIKIKSAKRSRSRIGILVMTTHRQEEVATRNQFNAIPLEFGHDQVRAYPFLRPAVYDNENRINNFVVKDIEEQIDEMAVLRRFFQ